MMSLGWVIHILSYLFVLPLLVGLVRWRSGSQVQRRLTLLVGVMGVNQLLQHFCFYFQVNNFPAFHQVPPLELTFLGWVFMEIFEKRKLTRLLPALILAFWVFCLVSTFFIQGLWQLPTLTRTVQSILVIGLVLGYFLQLLREMNVNQLTQTSSFWFVSGVFIYYAGSIFIFFYSNALVGNDSDRSTLVFTINISLLLILYFCYTIALLCKENPLTSSRASSSEPFSF